MVALGYTVFFGGIGLLFVVVAVALVLFLAISLLRTLFSVLAALITLTTAIVGDICAWCRTPSMPSWGTMIVVFALVVVVFRLFTE